MTEHLPECPWSTECPATGPHDFIPNQVGQIWCYKCTSTECQCEILRACAKRVLAGASEQDYANGKSHGLLDGYEDGYQEGYAEALDAAREAVDFVTVFIADVGEKGKPDLRQMIHVGSALTAIDALKEKP